MCCQPNCGGRINSATSRNKAIPTSNQEQQLLKQSDPLDQRNRNALIGGLGNNTDLEEPSAFYINDKINIKPMGEGIEEEGSADRRNTMLF